MGTKVKGIFKGLRHIFDEKQDEIVIGFPTDVKHVAHIGSDGPSTNQPSWMNEFKGSETSSLVDSGELLSSQGSTRTISEGNEQVIRNEIPKARRKSSSNTRSSSGSPKRGSDGPKQSSRNRNEDKDNSTHESSAASSRGSKHSRRNRSVDSSNDSTAPYSDGSKATSTHSRSVDGSTNSPTKDSSNPSSRRNRSVDASNDHSSNKDLPAIPKQSRRKKSDGSPRRKSSRSKEQTASLTDIQLDLDFKNNENMMA